MWVVCDENITVLYGELYGPLRVKELFDKVTVDDEVGTPCVA